METTQNQPENRMAVMPVGKLMIQMGVPMIISMMLQAVYNIVDSAFVANMPEVGEQALNALTLAFPVQMLLVAVGIGTGVGVNVLLARCLGQRDTERASQAAGNGLFLMAVLYVVFLLFGLFGTRAYLASQTKNAQILEMAADYLKICCGWSFGMLLFSLYEKVLQAAGKSVYSTIAQITGAVVNIVLDPILIYGWLGCPALGVKGAAYATVIGQIASALCGLWFHLRANQEVKNGLAYVKPSLPVIKNIYSIGFAAIIAQALMSVMTYLLNVIFVQISENVVTAYGLYYKIQQFILFAAFGLRDAITPIVSYNYGMGSRTRVREGIRCGLVDTLVIMLVGFLGLELLAQPFAQIFGLSGETRQLCVSAMRIISISYVFAGTNIACQGVFQALGCGLESFVISICRQLVFVIPMAYGFCKLVLAGSAGISLVWTAFPLAEALTMVIALVLLKRKIKLTV